MTLSRRFARTAFAASLFAAIAAFAGCSAEDAQLAEVRSNPTPELMSLGDSMDSNVNTATATTSTNLRAVNNDLGRLLLLDRPSRLTPQPRR